MASDSWKEKRREERSERILARILTCSGARREGNVVGEKLAILHDEMRIGGRIVEIPMNDGRQNARIWQGVAGDGDTRRRLAVRVVGRQQASETGVRLAPGWVLQVVAAAVRVPVGKVGVALDHLVLFAARHRVSRLARVQIDARQQLVRVRTLEHWLGGGRVQFGSRRRRRRLLSIVGLSDFSIAELRGLRQLQSCLVDCAREAELCASVCRGGILLEKIRQGAGQVRLSGSSEYQLLPPPDERSE